MPPCFRATWLAGSKRGGRFHRISKVMKRVFGLLLLILAIAGMVNVVRKFANASPTPSSSGSAAYDRGARVGRYSAPGVLVMLGLLGLRWLLQSDDGRPVAAPPRRIPPARVNPSDGVMPAKPWYKTIPAIVGFSVAGSIVGVVLLIAVLATASHWAMQRRSASHRPATPMISPPSRPAPPTPAASERWQPTQTGPYTSGANITAQWAGKWIPGTVVSINPGGFSVMVKLEDSRFPHPIVLSTNQLRLR